MSVINAGDFPIDPYSTSGVELASILNRLKLAWNTTNSGVARPTYAKRGTLWIDESGLGGAPSLIKLMMFDGANDIEVAEFNVTSGAMTLKALDKTGDTMSGDLAMGGNAITGVANVETAAINGGPLGFRNMLINGGFRINQRGQTGAVVLTAGKYGHDRWKAGAGGCSYTFTTAGGVTTMTITAGTLLQIVESDKQGASKVVLSWQGTAQGKIDAGALAASPVTANFAGGVNITVEFGTGTVSQAQCEAGSKSTPFENRSTGLELSLCQRYYEKTFSQDIAPVANTKNYEGAIRCNALAVDPRVNSEGAVWEFKVVKRVKPVLGTYNPQAVGSGWYGIRTFGSVPASALYLSDRSVYFSLNGTLGGLEGFCIHATADAEL